MGVPGLTAFLARHDVPSTRQSLLLLKDQYVFVDGHPLLHAAKGGRAGKTFSLSVLRLLSAIAAQEAEVAAGTRDPADTSNPLIEDLLTLEERDSLVWPFVEVRDRRCGESGAQTRVNNHVLSHNAAVRLRTGSLWSDE
jgi:hypothetical protein